MVWAGEKRKLPNKVSIIRKDKNKKQADAISTDKFLPPAAVGFSVEDMQKQLIKMRKSEERLSP